MLNSESNPRKVFLTLLILFNEKLPKNLSLSLDSDFTKVSKDSEVSEHCSQ